ncbi:MAG: glycosyltransferase family 2 protein [Bacteroidota bacterium]
MNNPAPARVAVVILNWNGRRFLEKFLTGVEQHTGDYARIVVADNASTDDSLEYLRKYHPKVVLLPMTENTGFTGGYNRALAQLDDEYFVLLNSDIEVTPGWLDPMIRFMDQHPDAGACQPKILDYNRRNRFEYAGASGGFIDRLGYPYCRGRIFQSIEQDTGQYDDAIPVFWATGACMMVRSSIYKKTGGLDERFFAHMEEIDLCWRIQNLGHSIHVIPSSVIYHVGGGTLPKQNPKKTYLNFRNNLMLLQKNLPCKEFSKIYRKRIVLDTLAAFSFLFTGGKADCKAVFNAHRDFRRMKKDEKKEIGENGLRTGDKRSRFSILFQYHVLKKQRFSQLPHHHLG